MGSRSPVFHPATTNAPGRWFPRFPGYLFMKAVMRAFVPAIRICCEKGNSMGKRRDKVAIEPARVADRQGDRGVFAKEGASGVCSAAR